MGGGNTRIIAAIGTRGFPTYVQYDLGKNGANGIYSATMGSSGCPSFTSIASNANGFVFGNQVAGSPYTTGAPMNAGSGTPCDYPISGGTGTCGSSTNQLGRIDIAVAPSNPNYIYAQAQSIVWNNNGGCGSTNGCQLGAWATTNGGTSWTYMEGSQGGALRDCRNFPATIRRTGTTRASLWIRTIRTACSSTPSTSGLRRAQAQCGTIPPAVIPTPAAQVRCTWTNMRSRFYRLVQHFGNRERWRRPRNYKRGHCNADQ